MPIYGFWFFYIEITANEEKDAEFRRECIESMDTSWEKCVEIFFGIL